MACTRRVIRYHRRARRVNRGGVRTTASRSMDDAAPEPPETVEVDQLTVACDGNGDALGHPRVFLTLKDGRVECPYCDRLFVLRPGASRKVGH
jgi:uncharacterized Zn-finger protein